VERGTVVPDGVGPAGIEPTTSTVKSRRSVQFIPDSQMRKIVSITERVAEKAAAAS